MTSPPLTDDLAELFDHPVIVTPLEYATDADTARVFTNAAGEVMLIQTLHDPYTRAAICETCGKVTAWRKVNNKFICRHEERITNGNT
jgi:hypothetical protein